LAGGSTRREGPGRKVVAIDYGAKRNILRCLASAGCDVTVLPRHGRRECWRSGPKVCSSRRAGRSASQKTKQKKTPKTKKHTKKKKKNKRSIRVKKKRVMDKKNKVLGI
jgi:hypothetical protein